MQVCEGVAGQERGEGGARLGHLDGVVGDHPPFSEEHALQEQGGERARDARERDEERSPVEPFDDTGD